MKVISLIDGTGTRDHGAGAKDPTKKKDLLWERIVLLLEIALRRVLQEKLGIILRKHVLIFGPR